jgi:hypothetical protein
MQKSRITNIFKVNFLAVTMAGFILVVGLACDLGAVIPQDIQIGQPEPSKQNLFTGITYERIVRQEPRLMIIHVVVIDLKANGIKVLVTPGDKDSDQPLSARTTSKFLSDFGMSIAINGDGFTPWRDLGPLGYTPHSGDGVSPWGFAASRGSIYSQDTDEEPTLYVYQNNKASMNGLVGKIYNAISGNELLVWNGDPVEGLNTNEAEPRTAVGLDRAGRRMIIVVVDGRQAGYSEGATLAEVAQILKDHKAFRGMNLDGGGSSTLVVRGDDGEPKLLNSPVHGGNPGTERPVGNHLGISAK